MDLNEFIHTLIIDSLDIQKEVYEVIDENIHHQAAVAVSIPNATINAATTITTISSSYTPYTYMLLVGCSVSLILTLCMWRKCVDEHDN